jgi:hypothetical protein
MAAMAATEVMAIASLYNIQGRHVEAIPGRGPSFSLTFPFRSGKILLTKINWTSLY